MYCLFFLPVNIWYCMLWPTFTAITGIKGYPTLCLPLKPWSWPWQIGFSLVWRGGRKNGNITATSIQCPVYNIVLYSVLCQWPSATRGPGLHWFLPWIRGVFRHDSYYVSETVTTLPWHGFIKQRHNNKKCSDLFIDNNSSAKKYISSSWKVAK